MKRDEKFFTKVFLCGILSLGLTYSDSFAAASCLSGYKVASHGSNPIANTSLIASEDGYCPSGYTNYVRTDSYLYPLMEDSILCAPGQYRANGTCRSYSQGSCPSGRYDSAIVSSTFIASEDGYCPTNYSNYTRSDDYVYPLVTTNNLCPDGQYRANGTCTSYAQSTCPSGYYSYSLNSATIAAQDNNACPANYTTYTAMSNCDVSNDSTCADIATVININWLNGGETVTTNSCTYNGAITLPTEPTKPGYTFAGWRLVED